MSIYGYPETVDDRIATLVVAADTADEYTNFCDTLRAMDLGDDEAKFNEIYTSTFMDAMVNDHYKRYKNPVLCFYHNSEEQREEFLASFNIVSVQSETGRDRQLDMLHAKKLEIEEETLTEEQKNMTIEERFGLDKADPWDRRTEEEKASDEEMKKKMKEMQKSGDMSGDSFGGADAQRSSRERFTGKPMSRTEAIERLDSDYRNDIYVEDEDIPNWDEMSNEELSRAFNGIDEADAELRPVFDDDKMPKEDNGTIHINKVNTDGDVVNEDGSINIDAITSIDASKYGGKVDEDLKRAREEAHEQKVEEKKEGRRSFDPGDFAAVLRGDGSADAVANVEGDDRHKRQASVPRPSLSEAAEAARKQYQDDQAAAAENAAKTAAVSADKKARNERDAGIFRGAALDPDGSMPFGELPENLQKELEDAGMKRDKYAVKNYPFNSELGGRTLIPYDLDQKRGGYRVLGGENIEIEGNIQLGDTAVAVIKRVNAEQEAIVICAKKSATDEGLDMTVVRIR